MEAHLKEKLLLLRARKYASQLDGVVDWSISLVKDDDFLWHRQEFGKAWKGYSENRMFYGDLPIDVDDFIKHIMKLLNISNSFSCYFVYDWRAYIAVDGDDFYKFAMKMFEIKHGYSLALVLINPDRILSIHQHEYDVEIYYKCSVS